MVEMKDPSWGVEYSNQTMTFFLEGFGRGDLDLVGFRNGENETERDVFGGLWPFCNQGFGPFWFVGGFPFN